MRIGRDKPAAVPSLEHVAAELVGGVEPRGVRAIEITHAFGQVSSRSGDQQVKVVGHQAVAVAAPAAFDDHFAEGAEEDAAIGVGAEDLPPGNPASRDVVQVIA
jgi:hypothetical protein